MTHHYVGLVGDWAAWRRRRDVQDPEVETGDTVAARIQNIWLAPKQTIVSSSCRFNHLPQVVGSGKLQAMSDAKRILGG